jgi:hypothetical protein
MILHTAEKLFLFLCVTPEASSSTKPKTSSQKCMFKLNMVTHTCNPSTQETRDSAGGSLVRVQAGIHSETLFQKKKNACSRHEQSKTVRKSISRTFGRIRAAMCSQTHNIRGWLSRRITGFTIQTWVNYSMFPCLCLWSTKKKEGKLLIRNKKHDLHSRISNL